MQKISRMNKVQNIFKKDRISIIDFSFCVMLQYGLPQHCYLPCLNLKCFYFVSHGMFALILIFRNTALKCLSVFWSFCEPSNYIQSRCLSCLTLALVLIRTDWHGSGPLAGEHVFVMSPVAWELVRGPVPSTALSQGCGHSSCRKGGLSSTFSVVLRAKSPVGWCRDILSLWLQ